MTQEHTDEYSPEYRAGMVVRREVLGDEHVDRAVAGTTGFTADFQRYITENAWGAVWTRPGLDRRTRSLITLNRPHRTRAPRGVRPARAGRPTQRRHGRRDRRDDPGLRRVLRVPDANNAFRIASQVLAELGENLDA